MPAGKRPQGGQATPAMPRETSGRLIFLDMSGDRICSVDPDGSGLTAIATGIGHFPTASRSIPRRVISTGR